MTLPLTLSQLDEWERLCREATPGPWEVAGAVHVYAPGPNGANVCSVSELRASTTVGYTPLEIGSKDSGEAFANADLIAEARTALPALIEAVRELQKALEPFAAFARAWEAKPICGLHDNLYQIHGGTEWEATLRLSDCKAARALLPPPEPRG